MQYFKKLTPKKLFCLIFAVIMATEPFSATKVLAIPDLYYYSANDILFYDPDASCGVDSVEGMPALRGDGNEEKIWNFLRDKGLTNEQTAGVMGNIQAESGFNPAIVEGGSGIGFGIVQWSFGRRSALEAAAAKKGVPPSDLGFQLEYLYQELTVRETNRPEYKSFPNEWEMLKGQSSIEDALVAFHHEFEVSHLMNKPNPRQAVIEARGGFAQKWFDLFSRLTPGGGGSEGGECEAAPTGNLSATIKAYAWPDYEAGKTQKKPEYEEAIKKAKSQGRYTGDTCFGGGVDCGGFITTLMIDSGFEPNYNHSGKVNQGAGATPTQEAWLKANWERVGTGSEVKVGGDASDPKVLRQGDVAIRSGHTYMYAGDIPGFNSKIASASQCDRAPMAGKESPTDGTFTWYRKKGG